MEIPVSFTVLDVRITSEDKTLALSSGRIFQNKLGEPVGLGCMGAGLVITDLMTI